MSRLEDARLAVEKYGWHWVNMYGIRYILVPPDDDKRRHWTAMWDENGIPHYMSSYSQGEN